jgi:hypothetical protein
MQEKLHLGSGLLPRPDVSHGAAILDVIGATSLIVDRSPRCTVSQSYVTFGVRMRRSAVSGQRSSVSGQRSAISGHRSAVSGQRSAVCSLNAKACSSVNKMG